MNEDLENLGSSAFQVFRLLGIMCCRRVSHLIKDKRYTKTLKKLEQSLGPPLNERLRRDAFNAANSIYLDLYRKNDRMSVEAAVACTLVCACEESANTNLSGNFASALSQGEFLSPDQIRKIEQEMITQIRLGMLRELRRES